MELLFIITCEVATLPVVAVTACQIPQSSLLYASGLIPTTPTWTWHNEESNYEAAIY